MVCATTIGLSNLELWIKPQPAGIRVSDAIAWAKEILDRYEDQADDAQQRFPL